MTPHTAVGIASAIFYTPVTIYAQYIGLRCWKYGSRMPCYMLMIFKLSTSGLPSLPRISWHTDWVLLICLDSELKRLQKISREFRQGKGPAIYPQLLHCSHPALYGTTRRSGNYDGKSRPNVFVVCALQDCVLFISSRVSFGGAVEPEVGSVAA